MGAQVKRGALLAVLVQQVQARRAGHRAELQAGGTAVLPLEIGPVEAPRMATSGRMGRGPPQVTTLQSPRQDEGDQCGSVARTAVRKSRRSPTMNCASGTGGRSRKASSIDVKGAGQSSSQGLRGARGARCCVRSAFAPSSFAVVTTAPQREHGTPIDAPAPPPDRSPPRLAAGLGDSGRARGKDWREEGPAGHTQGQLAQEDQR